MIEYKTLNMPTEDGIERFRKLLSNFYSTNIKIEFTSDDVNMILHSLNLLIDSSDEKREEKITAINLYDKITKQVFDWINSEKGE